MRRFLAFLFSLLAIAIASPASAQTPIATPEASPTPEIIAGASRQYTLDPTLVPSERPEDFLVINVHLFQYASDAEAAEMWRPHTDAMNLPLGDEAAVATPEVLEEEISTLGDRARAISLAATSPDGDTGHFRLLIVQDGSVVILATAIGGTEENARRVDDLVGAVTDRDIGATPVAFNADGTSTGGLWDKLPLTGDEDSQGLTAYSDSEIPSRNGAFQWSRCV